MLIKFCGMRQADSLELAASLGVNLCGFIFYPQSPRYIQPVAVRNLPTFGMIRTGVFVGQDLDEIREIAKLARLDLIQLHGQQDMNCALRLGTERIIRVVWPERFKSVAEFNGYLEEMAPACAFFLLDAGKKLGGSGRTLDTAFLESLISPRPWFLAGGLTAENINFLLKQIKPDGLDLNSGLESSIGVKDKKRMKDFFINLNKLTKNGEGL